MSHNEPTVHISSSLAVTATDAVSVARGVGAASNHVVPIAGVGELTAACQTPASQVRLAYFLLSRYVQYNQKIVPTSWRACVENEILSVDRGRF